MAAETGTQKNQKSESTAVQNTTGTTGSYSPSASAQQGSALNLGTQVSAGETLIYTANTLDPEIVDMAFRFGDSIATDLGKVYATSADAGAATQAANTSFLSGVLGTLSSQTDAGQATNTQRTLLYIVGGVLAVVALYFVARKT